MKIQSIIQKTLCYVLISHLHKYICLCNEECDIITPHIKGDHEDTSVMYTTLYQCTFKCSTGKLCTSHKHNTLIQVKRL